MKHSLNDKTQPVSRLNPLLNHHDFNQSTYCMISHCQHSELLIDRDFYVRRKARDEFQFPQSFYSIQGNIIIPNYRAAQLLADVINKKMKATDPQTIHLVQPAQLNAMGLLHELFHLVMKAYKEEVNKNIFAECEEFIISEIGRITTDTFFKQVAHAYPPLSVYKGEQSVDDFLNGKTGQTQNRQILLEELIILHLQHSNPALSAMADLIEEQSVFHDQRYIFIVSLIEQFFDRQPTLAPDEQPLIKMLMSSITSSPNSLTDQLAYVESHWKKYTERYSSGMHILQAIDFLKEEGKYFLSLDTTETKEQAERDRAIRPDISFPVFRGDGLWEKESPPVPTFTKDSTGVEQEPEPEKFSADLSWMPRLVLIAKNAFVWLHQLSKKYSRPITRLDQIPDEELDRLASFGITGLWLIGIWNRSRASKSIKHIHGNIDAEASAYSLENYDISDEIGGHTSYVNLRERAKLRGLRLACDMVPNHMGMDSDWVINHPDWFVQTDFPPYPNYSFNGPDLSYNDRVGVFLEDGYWRRSDAAVVFKRLDRYTGDVKYLYHGNDGTNMPWNDTAQLNFIKAEVREAVIQTILHVARMFPVIRFDAAMILAKKHYQRLWFPQPGTAGAVPSRAMFGMSKEQFDELMPIEFWREVVDRVQQEVPDTLLLAEAFWLMEGYFVRTLGMHRVYNSAFMHMLKKEENANFKQSIKNVMEFNPQILKRHVNFMSNPDEETAVAQFGSHDKYFGVCIMMLTLPGLPMFGHGQIEGFTEKYGMEYRRAYYDEQPDYHLVYRHEQEIVPLLKKRYLFAEVENFQLYDFLNDDGTVNEDVFVHTNRYGTERSLVMYNNAYGRVQGSISLTAAQQLINNSMVQTSLVDALWISGNTDSYYIFKDQITQLECLFSTREIREEGIRVTLDGYKYHLFLDFREDFASVDKPYHQLAERLNGRGVRSIDEELALLRLEPLHERIRNLLTESTLSTMHYGRKKGKTSVKALRLLENNFNEMTNLARRFDKQLIKPENELKQLQSAYSALLELTSIETPVKSAISKELKTLIQTKISNSKAEEHIGWHVAVCWLSLNHLTGLREDTSNIIDDWKLDRIIKDAFSHLKSADTSRDFELVKLLMQYSSAHEKSLSFTKRLVSILELPSVEQFIGINQWQDEVYFSKEQFEELVDWFVLVDAVGMIPQEKVTATLKAQLVALFEDSTQIKKLAETAGFKFEEFVGELGKSALKEFQTQAKVLKSEKNNILSDGLSIN